MIILASLLAGVLFWYFFLADFVEKRFDKNNGKIFKNGWF